MKINMPVTDNEIHMKPGDILVTGTDLKGCITYVNDAFVAISGFTREELIGASHNIVRHPDMPPEAFADLWRCLKQGKPWSALVKNRTKSGDFYWVEANVIPIYKGKIPHEYLSVRYEPSREQINQAEQFYKQLKAKTKTMRPTGLAAMRKALCEISIRARMMVSTGILAGLLSLFCYRLYIAQDFQMLSMVAALAASALTVNFLLYRSFNRFLEEAIGVVYSLTDGKFRNHIELNRDDRIGDFLRGLYSMQVNLNKNLAQSKQVAVEALRLNKALDNVQSGVMVADAGLNIIYMNKAVRTIFSNAEQAIRKQLPHFEVAKLVGSNIDIFHKNPAHQRAMLAKVEDVFRSELTIANLKMTVVVNPMLDPGGEKIGFVVEWLNRTEEFAIEQEISKVVQSAEQGNFDLRINEQGKDGFFLALSQNINGLLETSSAGLNEVVRILGALSHGDLTEKITKDYMGTFKQLKDDSNVTVENLRNLVSEIKEATDSIHVAAKEIAMGNNDLSHRTEEQAASLQQTAASMDQLTSTVQANSENAKQADQVVTGATEVASKGVVVVNQVVATMASINDSSQKISEIISVIDGIAFQTNILALNAAVEAARAGDQGRGFAVVAGEVRSLAQRAAAAAGEIKVLIGDSAEKIATGSKLVTHAGLTMKEIVAAINNVSTIMTQITAASSEQSAGISQVNQAIRQMDDVTQQNAALVEQAAASAESLEEQSNSLFMNVSKFKVDVAEPKKAFAKIQSPKAVQEAKADWQNQPSAKPNNTDTDWEEF